MIDPDGFHVLIDAEPLRVLELTPFAFAALLANQSQGVPGADPGEGRYPAFPMSADRRKGIISSIDLRLAIEPGSFQMGTTKEQDRLVPATVSRFQAIVVRQEQPQHPVQMTRPFFLGIHPVTQGQDQAIMGENPSHFKGLDDLPVEDVSWLDAVSFCNKMTRKTSGRRSTASTALTPPTWAVRATACPRRRSGNTPAGRGLPTLFPFW